MFSISAEPLHAHELKRALTTSEAGALVVFEGWVRNHNEGRSVVSLEYEAFVEMCEREAQKIMQEAQERFKIYKVKCVHRVGHLEIGDVAVWVGAVAAHRGAAFQACRYIIDEIKVRLPIWKKEHYSSGEAEWVNCQQCATHVSTAPAIRNWTSQMEDQFYSRQVSLSELGSEGQARLRQARVLLVGAGGLGCPVAQFLTLAGVGRLTICDGDRVELSNLHRQVLYTVQDVEQSKAEVAAQRLRAMNPGVEVIGVAEHIDAENVGRWLDNCDVLVDATDNFAAKFLLHDYAHYFKVPLVQASVYQREGQLQVFLPDSAAGCLRCLWPEPPEAGNLGSCAEVGVLGVLPGLFGTLQANEVMKILLGWDGVMSQHTLMLDMRDYDFHKFARPRQPDCPLCSHPITMEQLRRWHQLADAQGRLAEWELSPEQVKGAPGAQYEWVFIGSTSNRLPDFGHPIKTISPQRVAQVCQFSSRPVLVVCPRGIMSAQVVKDLRGRGVRNIWSLKGGTEGWN